MMISKDVSVLHLNLHREFFSKIANGTKRTEFRARTPYWKQRIEGRIYQEILLRNGYASDAPEMIAEYRGYRHQGNRINARYAIRLGKVLKVHRWKNITTYAL